MSAAPWGCLRGPDRCYMFDHEHPHGSTHLDELRLKELLILQRPCRHCSWEGSESLAGRALQPPALTDFPSAHTGASESNV